MNREEIYMIRAEWVAYLIDSRFNGSKEAFGEKVGYKVGSINHFLSPTSQRPCKDHAARKIERMLDLEKDCMDKPRTEKKEVYYVAISTNAQYTYETVSQLRNNPYVVECAAVLGDFDILIKVAVEDFRFLDTLLARLVKFPGVKRSQTYKAIENLHWQREQKEQMEIPDKEKRTYVNNGVTQYIYDKLNSLFDEIKLLEKETIIVKDSDLVRISNCQVIEGTKRTICAIRVYNSYMKDFEEFLKLEKELIQDKGVVCRRIIIYDKSNFYKKEEWKKLCELYDSYTLTGSTVKFLDPDNWVNSSRQVHLEKFIILDNSFVCIRQENLQSTEEDEGQAAILRNPELVSMYTDTFNTNWSRSISYETLHKRFLLQNEK
jgi:DNA-binding Lrp family transcriptional regulator